MQIVGTSEGFNKTNHKKNNVNNNIKKKKAFASPSHSEESYSSTSHGSAKSNVIQSFSPSTPPPTTVNSHRSAKRRKGIPHRAPFGSLILEY